MLESGAVLRRGSRESRLMPLSSRSVDVSFFLETFKLFIVFLLCRSAHNPSFAQKKRSPETSFTIYFVF